MNFTLGRTAFNFCTEPSPGKKPPHDYKTFFTEYVIPSRLSNSYSNGIFVIYKPFVTNVHGVIDDFVKTNFYDSP